MRVYICEVPSYGLGGWIKEGEYVAIPCPRVNYVSECAKVLASPSTVQEVRARARTKPATMQVNVISEGVRGVITRKAVGLISILVNGLLYREQLSMTNQ